MIRSSYGKGRYVANEVDVVMGTVDTFSHVQTDGIVYCHGSGDTATISFEEDNQRNLMFGLARFSTVMAADLGFQTWANDTAITRIGQSITYLESNYGVISPVVLVAGSMGAANALAYTRANPTKVKALALIIPLTDITDIYGRGAGSEIDVAYGGTYSDVTHGPTHNPIRFATSLPSNLPIHLWTSDNDPICVPATADAFVEARPQTERTRLGNYGHSDAAVERASSNVIDWVKSVI